MKGQLACQHCPHQWHGLLCDEPIWAWTPTAPTRCACPSSYEPARAPTPEGVDAR